MKNIIILNAMAFSLLILSSKVWPREDYFGQKSTEAILKFDGSIEITPDLSLTVDILNSYSLKSMKAKKAVEYQIKFLFGHFQSNSFLQSFKYPGVLSDQSSYKFTSIDNSQPNRQFLNYRFEGKSVFHLKAFDKSHSIKVPVRLPLNPYTLYEKTVSKKVSKCTDEHYNTEEDFFYFWDPDKDDCPLKGNSRDVVRIEGKLEKMENTKLTYPEYDRLYSSDELNISVFIGYIEEDFEDAIKSDAGYTAYHRVIKELKNDAHKVVEEKVSKNINFLTRFEKIVRNQLGRKQKVNISVLLSNTSAVSSDNTFTLFFSHALLNSHIIAFDGHSGLGNDLNVMRFGVIQLPSFYQIFYFNGCSTYPYFNSSYFTIKPQGKANLEIITAGLQTMAHTSSFNMLAFLDTFANGKINSYQTILNKIERSNGSVDTYLMGVNGDEDNKFRPQALGVESANGL